ncbi:unnamed protein product, partial [marine sediment metagenome]
IILLQMIFFVASGFEGWPSAFASEENAYEYLDQVFDQYHQVFYVYQDADSGGNHFSARLSPSDIPRLRALLSS